jgi:hypothetical protein
VPRQTSQDALMAQTRVVQFVPKLVDGIDEIGLPRSQYRRALAELNLVAENATKGILTLGVTVTRRLALPIHRPPIHLNRLVTLLVEHEFHGIVHQNQGNPVRSRSAEADLSGSQIQLLDMNGVVKHFSMIAFGRRLP